MVPPPPNSNLSHQRTSARRMIEPLPEARLQTVVHQVGRQIGTLLPDDRREGRDSSDDCAAVSPALARWPFVRESPWQRTSTSPLPGSV